MTERNAAPGPLDFSLPHSPERQAKIQVIRDHLGPFRCARIEKESTIIAHRMGFDMTGVAARYWGA